MTLRGRLLNVVKRWQHFLTAHEPGHFLIAAHVPTDTPALRPLSSFDLDRQLVEYLDERLIVARCAWAVKTGLDDDTLPALAPYFGIAEHSAC